LCGWARNTVKAILAAHAAQPSAFAAANADGEGATAQWIRRRLHRGQLLNGVGLPVDVFAPREKLFDAALDASCPKFQ
jgi:hypothetical protein